MLGSLSNMFQKITNSADPKKLMTSLQTNYSKLKSTFQKTINITELTSNLFHIDYPQKDHISQLLGHIGQSNYQIWNISEYKYEDNFQQQIIKRSKNNKNQNQIVNLNFQFYNNLPFYELIMAIRRVGFFLKSSKSNKVYIHCQDNKLRSAVFFVCFVLRYQEEQFDGIGDAISFVNQKLGIDMQSKYDEKIKGENSYRAQHLLFKHFINYVATPNYINKKQLKLLKIMINNAPVLADSASASQPSSLNSLKFIIEIRLGEKIVFKKIFSNSSIGQALCFTLNQNLILSDDFLLMVKYINKKQVYNMIRIQLNSNFIFDAFQRSYEQDIDFSSFCKKNGKELTFVDFVFQPWCQVSKLAVYGAQDMQKIMEQHTKQRHFEQQNKILQDKITQKQIQENFALHDDENQELDEKELNNRIESMLTKRQEKLVEENLNQNEQQDDFENYLSQLQEKAS